MNANVIRNRGVSMSEDEIACFYCGDEVEDIPGLENVDGEPICGTCYSEIYETFCPICEEFREIGEYKHFIIMDEEINVEPGIYEILKYPFFIFGLTSGDKVIESSVRKLCSIDYDKILTIHPNPRDAPVEFNGYICEDCVKKLCQNEITES